MKMQPRIGVLAIALAGAFALAGGVTAAQADVRVVFGTELGGGFDLPPGDTTVLTDSVVGQLCSANENLADCVGTPYNVPSTLIGSAFQANGGTFGINLCDDITNCAPSLSDQLYLSIGAPNADGFQLVSWCWDSDLDPNVNICQNNIANVSPINIQEQVNVMDLTSYFTGDGGPLAAGAWNVSVLSDVPEPITLSLFGAGLAGAVALRRRRKKAD